MKQLSIFGWHEGNANPVYKENMSSHCQFVRTQSQGDQPRNDLGGCIIQTSFPFLVFKIHSFRTSSPNFDRTEEAKKELENFINERQKASRIATIAEAEDMEVMDYRATVEQGYHYDEEFDEHRMISKVPGYNIYLEWYGSLLKELTADMQRVADIMQRATAYAACTFTQREREHCCNYIGQPMLCDNWDEDQDIDWKKEKERALPYRGIGKDHIDFKRRPTTKRRERISSIEAQEHEARQIERRM